MSDAMKPVACGACGGEATAHAVFFFKQVGCLCGVKGPAADTVPLAVDAWDAMWAGRAGEATKGPVGAAPFRDDRWILGRAAYEAAVACHQVQGIQVRKLHHWDDLGDSDRELYCQMAEGVMGKAGELGIAPSPDGGEGVGP